MTVPVIRRLGSLWYFAVVIASLGILAAVPFVHAAVRLRRRSVWALAAVYGVLDALVFGYAMVQGSKPDAPTTPLDAAVILTLLSMLVAACAQLGSLRREAYGLSRANYPTIPPPAPVDPAIAQVLAARTRRAQARHLVETDPLMARELHIGRPDLDTTYDDGGLVDLATAPAPVIAEVCGLTAEESDRIAAARGTFTNIDELLVLTDLPVHTWDRIRDRAVIVGP
ncbi:hypothetical protein [Actinokineospora iranica]|uniref:Helix-hairpin-helix motif-containing protein n=1 Tax=Actinokineospora iranica TaxID=1271860 RepID=A0A1G6K854_9PSEU|nr:hypothetical protein [Actinokineospora iranica]SDC27242.1 hypothetical protein SAMN05216174_101772 [Actinokineospora iranica]